MKAELAAQREAERQAEAAAKRARKSRVQSTAFEPLAPPALPISNEKQQRLAELLKKYKADQISPVQYHEQRAKILSEP